MRFFWTPAALQDRSTIWDYIANNNPAAAARMDALFSAAAKLIEYPKLGRPGQIPGTSELIPHDNYRLVYEIHNDTVWILTLIHTARN